MLTGTTSAAQPHDAVDQRPLTMWWLNTHLSSLTARLTHRLALTYTQPGDTVVSLTSDTYAATATLMARRNHITVNAPADLANIPDVTSLLTVQWPTKAPKAGHDVMGDLLLACKIIAGPGSCTVAVIAPTTRRLAAVDPFPRFST